tara:strand:+ start:1614 stop:3407 length:1794 start_codon:yes stop_codon:yes gene_type:complete
MSTLRTYNLQSIDSGSVNIQLSPNAGAILAGLTTAQSGFHITDGNVAIGTDAPDHNLHIYKNAGDAVITIESTGNGNDSALEFKRTSSGGDSKGAGSIYVTGDTSVSQARMHFGVGHNISHGSSPRMTIMGNGEVGIGTDNPSNLLDILQDTGRTRLNPFGHIISQNHNHGTTNYWTFAPRDGGELNIAYGAPDGNGVVTGEIVTMDVDGNVSIGTDNPTGTNPARLTVLSDPSTAVSYGSSDAFAVKSKKIDGTGISTVFAIRPFNVGSSSIGASPQYNVALSGTWFHFDAAGQNFNYLADDVDRTYVGFYTGASADQLKAGEYTTVNGDGAPVAYTLASITYRTTEGLEFSRGSGASADVSFKFVGKTSHGTSNKIVRFKGDSDALDLVNMGQGDYGFINTQQNNRFSVQDGTGGILAYYANDSAKSFMVENGGVSSNYISNTSATASGSRVRIHSNILKPESSTRRMKNNIRNYVGAGLSRIEQMVPRTWEDHITGETFSGFVAEEIHDIGFESAVVYREYQGGSEIGIGDTYGSMYGNGSTPVTKDGVELDDQVLVVDNIEERAILAELVVALKELKAENDSLKSRITALESN